MPQLLRTKLKRSATLDRGPPDGVVSIHTVEQIGPNMSKMPNGNLLCKNVPIARIGWMIYGPGETPIEVGPDGFAYVERMEDDLFDPVCIGSFMGAAVVDEHPDEDVTPKNWKKLSKGFATTNVRRGTGDDADVLLADLVISDEDLIESILAGKREVSCGYDANYEQVASGVGRQTEIIGNHIALVEKGRCGPRCAIGDQEFQPQLKKEPKMGVKRVKIVDPQRRVALDAARKKFRDAEAELENLEEPEDVGGDGGDGDTHIHLHVGGAAKTSTDEEVVDPDVKEEEGVKDDGTEARFAAIEQSLQVLGDQVAKIADAMTKTSDADPEDDEKKTDDADPEDETKTDDEFPDDEKDEKSKTADSRAFETGYKQVMAQAELLVPGFRMPTFDAKAKRAVTIDKMCSARRQAMTACYATQDGATLINSVVGTKTVNLAGMNCKDLAVAFKAAAGAKALLNNAAATKDSGIAKKEEGKKVGVNNISSLNEANRQFWLTQNKQ